MTSMSYIVTNETRGHLQEFAEDLIDIAAQGNAPSAFEVANMIERIIEDQFYEPERRNAAGEIIRDGDVVGECERCGEDVVEGDGEYLTGEEARGGVQHARCYDDDPEGEE